MTTRRLLLSSALAVLATLHTLPLAAQSSEPTRVVATFSILGDMVARIGGEHIVLTTLVGPEGDAHVYQPTPAAARAVSEADVLIFNGLELEGWLSRLTEAAGFKGDLVVATTGIEPIAFEDDHGDEHDDHDEHAEGTHDDHDDGHDDEHAEDHGDKHDDHDDEHAEGHGDDHKDHAEHDEHAEDEHGHHHGAYDPHAWQSLGLAVTYVDNIAAALAKANPGKAGAFYENRAAYVAEIEALRAGVDEIMAAIPEDKRTVVTSHDAFQYFGRDYGLTFLAPQGLGTETEASARDVAKLIEQMREEGISAVFVENIADPRLIEQIATETGASVGGKLYPGALSGQDGPAPTYLDMMRHNAATIAATLGSEE